ncbi:cyclic nucleotide-gated cation channel beta-3 [Phlebotomus papatasi]|uniref:cyclic nucleotide-gated cation channel beta-3 n=1 Tax=Phlebotomus papatasi TaxID=29031 RepID=UPI002483B6DA|nr:cyclic nucleotide-gated cation channel beta-3 [Phlebotomus papatasi]
MRATQHQDLSETLQKHLFIERVIQSPPASATRATFIDPRLPDIDELSTKIKDIEDFMTVTEQVLKQERRRDNTKLFDRDSRRGSRTSAEIIPLKDCSVGSRPVSRLMSFQEKPMSPPHSVVRQTKSGSPKGLRTRLYFRNGRVGCAEADVDAHNVQNTHALVRHIIAKEHVEPLVPLDCVNRILAESEIPEVPVEDVEVPVEADITSCVQQDERDQANDSSIVNLQQISPPNSPTPDPEKDHFVRERMQHLISRFSKRAHKMKRKLEIPPTPSSSASSPSLPVPPPPLPPFGPTQSPIEEVAPAKSPEVEKVEEKSPCSYLVCPTFCGGGKSDDVLDPQGQFYISWLFVVTMSFLYNAYVIPLRSSFPFQTDANTLSWIIMDLCADAIYLIDIVFIKHRLMFLLDGFWVRDKERTRQNYVRKFQFKMDMLSLLPLDILYLIFGTKAVLLRIPRLLKIQSFWEFFKLLDRVLSSPHIVRVAKTLTYMLFMIHLTACAYYAYSAAQGLGTNRWVFSGKGHPYMRCFAFATKTATSIGKNPKPENDGELLFMTAAWLMGVFVFALLIGQIRDIIATATRSQSEYKQLVDEILEYMRRLNLPTELRHRVKMWFTFTWEQQRTLDERHILDSLPANLKTDVAISVHIQTLSKVQLFADCEEALLRELVLKLRSVTFLPGDFVCRKNEVGKEMYIVKLGQVQVMGGPNNDEVLATLSEGSVFGEISLLAINGGGNRRTADVRSRGFSNLFVLSKSDLNEAIVYYPNAQAVLKRRAKSLMRRNAAREAQRSAASGDEADVVIENPKRKKTPPKLLEAVIKALPQESPAVTLLTQGSKKRRKRHTMTPSGLPRQWSEVKERVMNGGVKTLSCDLLLAIQNELEEETTPSTEENSLVNLTDSQKELMQMDKVCGDQLDVEGGHLIETSQVACNGHTCDVTVHIERESSLI